MIHRTNIKSGKYLANQLKHNKEKSIITAVKDSLGNPTQNPQNINDIFRTYYSKLYTTNKDKHASEIDSFLNNIKLPKLNTDQAKTLDAPLTAVEFEKAVKHLANNKTPESDGYPAEFFEHFWQTSSPLFTRMATEI